MLDTRLLPDKIKLVQSKTTMVTEDNLEKTIRMSKIQSNPYRAVLAWFLQEFKDYDSYKKFFKDLEKQKDSETKDVNIEKMPSVVNE